MNFVFYFTRSNVFVLSCICVSIRVGAVPIVARRWLHRLTRGQRLKGVQPSMNHPMLQKHFCWILRGQILSISSVELRATGYSPGDSCWPGCCSVLFWLRISVSARLWCSTCYVIIVFNPFSSIHLFDRNHRMPGSDFSRHSSINILSSC